MIFVTVGTTDFDALARRMDEIAVTLDEEVVMQTGRGVYAPRHARSFRFAPSLEEYYRQARLVVSHGGLGTLVEVLRLGKPLIGVSNPDRYDLHQNDLLGELERGRYMVWCRDLAALDDDIRRIGDMQFRRYDEPPCSIHLAITAYLQGGDMSPWTRVGER
jgi:UDP-N-acetylglucosamine transferase subunit ALG13